MNAEQIAQTIISDFNRLKNTVQQMKGKKIKVGILSKEGSDVLKIAAAHEYGAVIFPTNGKFLAIPLNQEAEEAGSPRSIPGLKLVPTHNGFGLIRDKGTGKKEDNEWMYLLAPHVVIPERSYIRASYDANRGKIKEIVSAAMNKVMRGEITPEAAMNSVGAQCTQLIQNFIDENRVQPKVSDNRQKMKTQHTTLYETGTHIRDRISFEVVDE